jgi:hypothetical protein
MDINLGQHRPRKPQVREIADPRLAPNSVLGDHSREVLLYRPILQ